MATGSPSEPELRGGSDDARHDHPAYMETFPDPEKRVKNEIRAEDRDAAGTARR